MQMDLLAIFQQDGRTVQLSNGKLAKSAGGEKSQDLFVSS
jgi:hypothetical protein